jgi:hypothetical protein
MGGADAPFSASRQSRAMKKTQGKRSSFAKLGGLAAAEVGDEQIGRDLRQRNSNKLMPILPTKKEKGGGKGQRQEAEGELGELALLGGEGKEGERAIDKTGRGVETMCNMAPPGRQGRKQTHVDLSEEKLLKLVVHGKDSSSSNTTEDVGT